MIPAKKLSGPFANVVTGMALGLAIMTVGGCDSKSPHDGSVRSAPEAAAFRSAGATMIDLSANPKDLSPAVNHITATAKEARAANQKVIILLGEEHSAVNHVRLAELLRRNLKSSGVGNPVMAVEQQNNLLEHQVLRLYPGNKNKDARSQILQALGGLKKSDLARYRQLQALAHMTVDWPEAPLTRLENFTNWLEDGTDVRLVDLRRVKKGDDSYLDAADPATASFIKERTKAGGSNVKAGSLDAFRPRNAWMAAELRDILEKNDIVILQTGFDHLGGDPYMRPYKYSLHALFENAANDNIKVITVFQEKTNFLTLFGEKINARYEYLLSVEARAAMNKPDTIILRGSDEARHDRSWMAGTFDEEFAALTGYAHILGTPEAAPRTDGIKYQAQLEKNREALKAEIKSLIAEQHKTMKKPSGPG